MIESLRSSLTGFTNDAESLGMKTLRDRFDDVDSALDDVESVLGSLESWEAPLAAGVATHLVTAGGKRLRPALMFLCYGAAGGTDLSVARPYAVGCELIHTATLLHDDVIDDGTERRGKPTANKSYGDLNAVLSGDYLVAHVINELLELNRVKPVKKLSRVMTHLVQGELLQDEYSQSFETETDQYLQIARLKTSSLFSYAAWTGGYLVDGDGDLAAQLSNYAENLGIAFQMVDDVLDFEYEQTGKTPFADIQSGTTNLCLILGMQRSDELKEKLQLIRDSNSVSPDKHDDIINILRKTSSLENARSMAKDYSSRARACIEGAPDNAYVSALDKLADYVYGRLN
ncbi:MAG: polyprenyl synthetase family protein [bacterium]